MDLKERLSEELYKLELAEMYTPEPHQVQEYYEWLENQHNIINKLVNQIEYEESRNTANNAVNH